jgi:hypothetical protein
VTCRTVRRRIPDPILPPIKTNQPKPTDTAGFQRCSDRTSAPSRGRPSIRMYSVGFPTQLLSIGCARLCEWSRLRRGGKRGPRSSRAWVTVITCELFWTQLGNWHCSERRRGAVLVLVGAHAIGDLRLQCLVAAEGKPILVVEYPSTPQQTERLCLGRNRVVHKNHIS